MWEETEDSGDCCGFCDNCDGCWRLEDPPAWMHAPEQRIAADETKLLRFALSRARALRRGPLNRIESAERCSEAAANGSEGKRNESKN